MMRARGRPAGIGLALALAVAACAPANDVPAMYANLAAGQVALDAGAARALVNGHRELSRLPPLVIDARLMAAAERHARAMAAADKVGGDAGEGDLARRLAAQGVTATARAENVSAGYLTLAEAFSGWRESEPHNRTMLLAEGRRMGIAAAYAPGTKYRVFWSLIVTGE